MNMETQTQPISELPLHVKAELALKQAVARVVESHRRLGLPLVVWRDGKVVFLPPDQAQQAAVHEPRAEYRTGDRDEAD